MTLQGSHHTVSVSAFADLSVDLISRFGFNSTTPIPKTLERCLEQKNIILDKYSIENSTSHELYVCLICQFQPPAQTLAAPMPASLPPPIRMRVRVQEDVFLIPVPQRLVYMSYVITCFLQNRAAFCMLLSAYSHAQCTVLQRGRLLHCVVAVRAGRSALLPEMWPPASPLPAEGRRSALPAGPAAGCPAHQ